MPDTNEAMTNYNVDALVRLMQDDQKLHISCVYDAALLVRQRVSLTVEGSELGPIVGPVTAVGVHRDGTPWIGIGHHPGPGIASALVVALRPARVLVSEPDSGDTV